MMEVYLKEVRMKSNILIVYLVATVLTACTGGPKKEVLEVGQSNGKPNWVNSTKISWNEGDQVFFRTQYTIRGSERINGCYQLAKLETKETLLREISEDIKGQIDNAQQSISEDAEIVLNQSRTGEYRGKVTGLRFLEQYHERYRIDGTERIDCFILGSIRVQDYESIRRAVVYKMAEVDPGLRQALNQRQVDFFSHKQNSAELTKEVPKFEAEKSTTEVQ